MAVCAWMRGARGRWLSVSVLFGRICGTCFHTRTPTRNVKSRLVVSSLSDLWTLHASPWSKLYTIEISLVASSKPSL